MLLLQKESVRREASGHLPGSVCACCVGLQPAVILIFAAWWISLKKNRSKLIFRAGNALMNSRGA